MVPYLCNLPDFAMFLGNFQKTFGAMNSYIRLSKTLAILKWITRNKKMRLPIVSGVLRECI